MHTFKQSHKNTTVSLIFFFFFIIFLFIVFSFLFALLFFCFLLKFCENFFFFPFLQTGLKFEESLKQHKHEMAYDKEKQTEYAKLKTSQGRIA